MWQAAHSSLKPHGLRFLICLGLVLVCLLSSFAWAEPVTISTPEGDPKASLEIRNAVLPDGSELQYYVLTGSPATITIDGSDKVIAEHLEIDITNKVIRIIGFGTIITSDQTTQGDNLTFSLEDETFRGDDVLILTEAIDVIGVDANRIPGQVSVLTGRFSPCSRCSQDTQDYGFRAERLELFPGDRLVAFNVTVVIRDLPVFFLPLLVVPLAAPERQPRLTIETGTLSDRARVLLDWPYVSGANAYGTTSLRYYADVRPGEGNFFSNTLLGGAVVNQYLGGEINHRFFTDTGKGTFVVAYTPSFVLDPLTTPTGTTDELYKLSFTYATEVLAATPLISVRVDRDDATNNRIAEYQLSVENTTRGLIAKLSSQGYVDFDTEDEVSLPSFTPYRSLELDLRPETERYSVGPFSLSEVRLNLGVFQGRSNPNNRSAALSSVLSAGRLLEAHTLTLESVRLWSGLDVSGSSSFLGQYYSTRNPALDAGEQGSLERFVNWNSNLALRQSLGGVGSINITFGRNINEGETPFAFDAQRLGSETFLSADVSLTPLPWLSFFTNTRYVFASDRPNALGFDPINSRLTLFSNLNWLQLELANSYQLRPEDLDGDGVKETDPGTLTTTLTVNSPDPAVEASLSATLVNDLKVTPDRASGRDLDESRLDTTYRFGVRPYVAFDLSSGYRFNPPELDPDSVATRRFWEPLTVGLTVGTPDQQDLIPSFRVGFERDMNESEFTEVQLEFTAAVQPVELRLAETINVRDEQLGSTNYSLSWRGLATLEASGFALLPPGWLGLELADVRTENRFYQLSEARETGEARWRVNYQTRLDYSGDGELTPREVISSNSLIDAFVNLEESRLGEVYFGVDFDLKLRLEDDTQALTYLQNANLDFFSDYFGVVGFQGILGYQGIAAGEELSSSSLALQELALTVKLFDQLYVSTVLTDTWTFVGTPEGENAFNFQPEFRVTWDRCCWALYSSWDTGTGAISITLTTPGGGDVGLSNTFDTSLRLPGNRTPQDAPSSQPINNSSTP